jgi:hypothetical protein
VWDQQQQRPQQQQQQQQQQQPLLPVLLQLRLAACLRARPYCWPGWPSLPVPTWHRHCCCQQHECQ